ncbi:MAG: glycosyltransferase [Rhodothermales bacterium]
MGDYKRWRVVDIDAGGSVPALQADPLSQGTLLYVWWKSVPLGHSFIPAERLPLDRNAATLEVQKSMLTAATHYAMQHDGVDGASSAPSDALRNLGTVTEILDQLADLDTTSARGSDITVVVCTRDRPEHLSRCLASLDRLRTSPKEIVVVDNASRTDDTREVVAGHANARYIREDRPGLDVARNTGFVTASSELVAFTDDDVAIEPTWLDGIARGFSDPSIDGVTGLVLAGELETEAQELFERYWSFNRGYIPVLFGTDYFEATRHFGTPAWEIGAGANMAFRRSVFDRIGGFDERLDVGAAGCSGDSEYWHRMLTAGMTIRYEPTAVVRHYHRRDENGLRKQLHDYMRGHTAALLVQNEKTGGHGNLRRLFVSLPNYYGRLAVKRAINRNPKRGRYLFDEIAGYFSGIRFYLNNRSR